ncbi:MAG: ABC transporter ATP-binding protein [Desulfobacterales bacterium]
MALLTIQNVSKFFGKLAALTEIDLEIQEGELVGLVGPNGSGKTTLFNVISGFYHPSEGEVFYQGKRITNLRSDRISSMGLVRSFQSNLVYKEATCLENVIRGFYLHAKTSSWQAFFSTGAYRNEEKEILRKAEESLDFWGLSSVRDIQADELAHGFQRCLGLVIAFSAAPRLLLLDEPVAGMNTEEIVFVMDRIKELANGGMTVLLVEHHVKTVVDFCQRLIVLNYGLKIADGKPEDVIADQQVIDAYLGNSEVSK